MLKARVKYIGRRTHENNGRYAEFITPAENTGIVSCMLSDFGYITVHCMKITKLYSWSM